MAKVNTHLHFDGRCLEALKFYEKCFNGKITFSITWGESPVANDVPAHWANKILHASVEFTNQMITADDAPPGRYAKPQGFQIMVSFLDLSEAEKVFKALSEKGKVGMPFGKTFWAKGFGMVEDQFGIPWMVNCAEPE